MLHRALRLPFVSSCHSPRQNPRRAKPPAVSIQGSAFCAPSVSPESDSGEADSSELSEGSACEVPDTSSSGCATAFFSSCRKASSSGSEGASSTREGHSSGAARIPLLCS